MSKPVLTIDGNNVYDFASFIQEFNRTFSQFDVEWSGNLDAFNDYLVWPDGEYILVWERSELSRQRLGFDEMVKWLGERVQHCHPANVPQMRERLEAAKRAEGQTMFDLLVEIIRGNKNYVELRLA